MIIYTTIFGPYDHLKEPLAPQSPNVTFVCYTDQPTPRLRRQPQSVWSIIPIHDLPFPGDPLWSARWYKHHPPNGKSVWIDSSLVLLVDIWETVNAMNADLVCLPHPKRACVYHEGPQAARRLQLQNRPQCAEYVARQIEYYRHLGLPPNNGLHASGLVFRRDTAAVRDFQNRWWNEMRDFHSPRDQVALARVEWETGFAIAHFPASSVRLFPHNNERPNRIRADGSLPLFG